MTAPTDELVAAEPEIGDPLEAQSEAPTPDPGAYLRGYHVTAALAGVTEMTKGAGYVLERALRQSVTPGRNTRDARRWWRHVLTRRRPQWHNEHEIVFETPIARLRDFSQGAATSGIRLTTSSRRSSSRRRRGTTRASSTSSPSSRR